MNSVRPLLSCKDATLYHILGAETVEVLRHPFF